ncbi:GNAT family N-acetyltransferase [Mucilaginibacter psychrotolerans]|uniref:N-acetyltransferase n=1 Tax=Mucilaginibacter psychrotolerans TaxID=1524096 RepID=A0A4Y8S565_9SPHI|nr:GNAT family protein [Mucilaginibacter psychrotolerans]TFF34109.1 N-acetyltransferase [Mucilaginibacter psychrotolerans]
MLQVNLHPLPLLQTPRLTLRAITFDDSEAFFALRSSPEVMKYIDRPPAKTIEEVTAWIKVVQTQHEKNDGIMWGICLNGNRHPIGNICFWRLDKENHRAEIGYMLSPAYQGLGIMQEAMNEVIKYAFEAMRMHSIEANVNPANQASINTLERCGFVPEAYFRENYFSEGHFLDSAIYSLITTIK